MGEKEIDFKFLYPNLIIFLGPNKNESLFKQIQKSFNEFQYGPLFKQEGTLSKHDFGPVVSTCRIMQGSGIPICLANGVGSLPCDAEQQAVENLLNKLCNSCYVIKASPQYFAKKNIPCFALNADSSHSHIYKVVFLRKNSRGVPFPKPVSGAIDYVENYNELMEYIETHAKSETKADLFILNVLKSDRARIRQVCQKSGLTVKFLVGCSDMGVYAFHVIGTVRILQSLLKDGGKNVKYKLIGPRDKYGDNEDKVDEKKVATEEIAINQWIADRLVIMEVVTERNELESTKEIIWRSVRDCPDTNEFIIEKSRNNTGVILAEALIDRKLVGQARGFDVNQTKLEAAENAMQNLAKCCYYIEAKKSYFGSSLELPNFLQQPNSNPETKIYRIADKKSGLPNKILQQFKSAFQEDLYFLQDFTDAERKQIEILAKKMNFRVRWIGGKSCLCVYKKRKPNQVLMELLSTLSKENEKYKLIIPPPKIHQQMEERATHQDWNNQGIRDDSEANIQAISRSPESYYPPSEPDTRANTSDHQSASQSQWEVQQGAEAGGRDCNETPNWVMNYIQSAPKKNRSNNPHKHTSHPTESPRLKNDVYSRYKFIPPKPDTPPVFSSNVNYQGADKRPNQNVERDHVNPSKDLDSGSTISERVQRMLEEKKFYNKQDLTNRQNKQVPSRASNKRPYDQGFDVREECEPKEKQFKPTANPHRSQYANSFGRQSSKDEGEPLNNFSEDQMSESSVQKPRTWDSNVSNSRLEDWSRTGKSYDRSFTGDHSFEGEDRSPYNEWSSIKEENEYKEDTNKLFDRRPESTQHNNSQWDQGTKHLYGQRPNTSSGGQHNLANLFDYSGPQDVAPRGYSRPLFPPRPPPPWKKNSQFKGHSFGKLAKYGKKKGP